MTVSQRGRNKDEGVGLLLRTGNAWNDFAAFYIDPDGFWNLSRYHGVAGSTDDGWSSMASGYSKDIHRGEGAENRLLVLMRGETYTCYINEQYVGFGQDHQPPLKGGRLGVFSNTSVVETIYSDFRVYAAPPETFF